MADGLDIVRSDVLSGIPHGFFGRRGGVSTGAVSGLQFGLGAGDDPAHVAENRRRAAAALAPGAALVMPYQVHSPDAAIVKQAFEHDARPKVDAVVTDQPGLMLGIVTADCAPVLLADAHAGVVAAAHAGWRGAQSGVIDATIAAMLQLGAQLESIAAAVGPCIAQASYEVDAPFRAHFTREDEQFFSEGKTGHCQFDLEGYVADRLRRCGITQVDPLRLDTYSAPERFYSFRRATHRGEASYGRQASLIGLPTAVA